MYTLHYAPDNASLIIRLVLDGAGIPYRTALVDRARRQQDGPDYRALNPTGLIPTLETPHGALSETGAILLWLTDAHQLGPAAADPDRIAFLKWLFFLSNTAHAELRQIFYPHQYAPADRLAAHIEIMSTRMLRHFGQVEAAAVQHPKLFAAGKPLGIYAIVLTRWSALYPATGPRWLDMRDLPMLDALCAAQEARVETRVIGRAEGLGAHPFTRPEQPNPPEGSVL
ncbi:MAG: glutathione S-transferase [Acetobacteraceae bacterium]|nr:MAG: glutathione S-transferase [Acetobacteraceae bacterium]